MNRNLHLHYFITLLICSVTIASAQKINVNNSGSLEDLILNNLINGCVEVTNITSSINGSSYGFPSYGQFTRGNSNFPFESGILLSTGNALSAGNSLITPTLSEGSTAWGSDPDLEAALGVTNTLNATSIEFDIVSTSNQLQFNYLLASEEYEGVNSCQFSDGFAFLIKPTGSADPYQNIALIPNTTIPVNTGTIHPQLGPNCPAVNEQYFDGYNIGDTNYEGRTTVLTASTTITPYVSYHIKLVIADQSDQTFDSSVFIEGDSFNILDLGEDIATCSGSALLDADIQNPSATYKWFLNNTEIIGQTNPTLNVIQNGTYKVEVSVPLGNNTCVEEDEIVVTLNTEESINPISTFELCDDLSGDGIETFDLSNKNTDIENNIPISFTNYTYSYHISDADARNNTGSITTPIQNTSSPQPIYVRIENMDTGCIGFTTFNLIVNTIPNITPPTPLRACDSDSLPDGFSIIDLTEKDDEIAGGNSNLIVSYHYNQPDANSGNNPISTFINSTTPNDMVYVRVFNTQTGCVNTTTLDILMDISPLVITDTQFMDACDTDMDGFATFNLTEVLADILNGLTGVTPSFYETFSDAQSGTNPIADPTNYTNTQPNVQGLYVRVQDDVTGCATIVPIQVHSNLLLTGTAIEDYALCDTEGSGGVIGFNLTTVETYVANDLDNISVTFFESENERNNNINPISTTSLYNVSNTAPKTLYLRINNGVCEEVAEIRLIVNPILLFTPTLLTYCDNDDDVTDGIITVDLSSFDDTITNGNTDFTVRYFPEETDAETNFNQLPPFYSVTGTETIWVRIENIVTGCSTVSSFDIQIIQAPETNTPDPKIICDDDQDGFSIINLEDTIPDIVTNPIGLTIDFFTTSDDAEAITNAISVSERTAFNATSQTIYIRVASNTCYKIVPLEIIVNTLPVFPVISILQVCEDDTNQTEAFILSDKDAEILNGQTGKEVYYFENETDALNGTLANAIDKNNDYFNISPTQTIYVRVENITDSGCFGTSSFTIRVSSNPIYNTAFEDYFQCDDRSNDEEHLFDLSEKIAEIRQGSPDPSNLNVTFHLTSTDAQNGMGALPLQYTNASNPQTLYIRIQSTDTQCVVFDEIGINIVPSPNLTDANPLEVCDTYTDRLDGIAIFNLDNADYQNLDRIQTITVHYFENFDDINQDDALDNSLAITNPTNYISDSKTVYIKVTNTITNCFTTIPLELIVDSPPAFNTIGTIEICDNDTDTYDLTQVDSMLLNDPSFANISYHNSQADADNNVAPIGNIFNYTSTSHLIFARLSDINTGCFITSSFNLQINPNPIANTPPNLVECDDNYDGIFAFDLSQNNNPILGAQNPTAYTITYYTDLENAEAGINALNNSHPAINGDIIYARLENNNTGCYDITQFTVFVNPLPVIPVNDVNPLCVNDLPLIIDAYTGNPNDTYLWSTGETTPQIELGLGDAGNYLVTVTRPYTNAPSCEFTKPFSVIESAIADINFTATVDFSDPNSITVDVSGIGDYVYILDGGEPQESNVFENVSLGTHTVTVRDLNGCEDISQEVTVFDIPKFVTPNNDGYFDRWHVVDFTQLPGTIVYIYDRYGKLLKTLPHTSLGWDGTYNGANMPADDYWFVANIIQQGNAFTIKGHFALKR